jgi:predicted flap endonuclease-1-like 5' DNA nuclease
MRVVLTDGTELSCTNFKAIDSGVLLTKDKKRKKVVGFVPHHQLRYVVPDGLEPTATAPSTAERENDAGSDAPGELSISPPETPTEPVDPAETTDAAEASEPADGASPTASDLRRLGGLGSTYAERLQSAGYETLADLAGADPVAVAEAASVAPGRGRRWVNAAGRALAAEGDADTGADADASAGTDTDVDADTSADGGSHGTDDAAASPASTAVGEGVGAEDDADGDGTEAQ